MSNVRDFCKTEKIKAAVLLEATKLFRQQGYTNTTVREIAEAAGLSKSNLMYAFKSKEDILAMLVTYAQENRFSMANRLVADKTEDPLLIYAVETALQLYITESDENIRDVYSAAYSLPTTVDIIQHTITQRLERVFKNHLPDLQTRDFYELEIASSGIMRAFITRPCDIYFTIERKVARFLETIFLIWRVSEDKIRQAIDFVYQFDLDTAAEKTVQNIMGYCEKCLE